MAKRKAARATRRKGAPTRRAAGRGRSAPRKAAGRKRAAKKTAAKKTASARVRHLAKKPAKKAARKAVKKTAPKTTARVAAKPKATAKAPVRTTTASKPRSAPGPKMMRPPARTAPGLNRERRTIRDDDVVQTPPSSLSLDRSASAVRTGRREMLERFAEHTETSPAMTGGDVDADWESAYAVGDEAPGGDNPTPDQDIVDDIGHAIGVEYQDNEELKGEAKISKRDRNRWELDPASSDDWDER
jgi:hypothetical protein